MAVLSLDIGGTYIKWAILNPETYHLQQQGKVVTPKQKFKEFQKSIQNIIDTQLVSLSGISISLPGTMNTKVGNIFQGGSLRYMDGVNLIKVLHDQYNVPVSIENDARSAATAELQLGSLRNVSNALIYVVGTGIGGAIINERKIFTGTNFYAGEFSLMMNRSNINKSPFIGDQLSVPGLVSRVKDELKLSQLDGEKMMILVDNKDKVASTLFDQYTDLMVDNLITLQFIFAPESIAIGGGISANAHFIKTLQTKYEKFFNTQFNKITIKHAKLVRCQFANNANLIGGFLKFREKYDIHTSNGGDIAG